MPFQGFILLVYGLIGDSLLIMKSVFRPGSAQTN